MKIEIWSDVSCPFCYIGKKTLENAISKLNGQLNVEVEYKSFELDPYAPKDYRGTVYDYLAEKYGRSHDEVLQMTIPVAERARELGLNFNFDIAKHTNTFDAHRLLHLAKEEGLQHTANEVLFKAYFEEGFSVSDHQTLKELGAKIGLTEERIEQMLNSGEFTTEVKADINEARSMKVNGVPFFLFNKQYAVSGAQPEQVFLQVLEELSLAEIKGSENNDGLSCGTDGNC